MIKCLSKVTRTFFICCLMLIALFPTLLKAAWTQPPTLISEPSFDTRLTNGACLDVNASNNGVATWVGDDPANVYATSYTFGIGWSLAQVLNSQAVNIFDDRIFINIANSQVSLNETNFAAACWQGDEFIEDEVDTTYPGIYTATRSPNGVWAPQQLASDPDSPFEFFPSNPCGAINDAGTFVVVWIERRSDDDINTYYFTMANIQQVGGGWGAPIQIGGPFYNYPNDPTPPDVEINSRGDIVATWKRFLEDGTVVIEASIYTASTNTWTGPTSLDPGLNFDDDPQDLPKAGIDEKGNAVVVWLWSNPENTVNRVYGSSFTPGSGWGPAILIQEVSDPNVLFESQVVMDRFGNSTAIWSFESNVTDQVFSSSLTLNGTWSTPVIISTVPVYNYGYGNLVQRTISVDLNGNVIVIFRNDTNTASNVYSVANFKGLGWQTPELISSDALFPDQFDPTNQNIGLGSCGFAIAIWQAGAEEAGEQVWASTTFGQTIPPCLFTGTQCREKLATQSICVNRLTWGFCNLSCTQFYNLYRNGTLIATIPVNNPHAFNDPVACRSNNVYTLTAVNIYGIESSPATVMLP